MAESFTPIVLSNICFATGIAVLAWTVQRFARHPGLAHVLWLMVLLKLITPPLVALPWLPIEQAVDPVDAAAALASAEPVALFAQAPAQALLPAAEPAAQVATQATPTGPDWSTLLIWGVYGLWLLGSILAVGISGFRVVRFQRLLNKASRPVPQNVRQLAESAARQLGLRRCPDVVMVDARLSPFVWWAFGRLRVVIPAELPDQLPPGHLRNVLAHELAHVRRGDHVVRWLEWLSGIAFWWNPIFWWARHHLRLHEELGCDALVLHSLRTEPRHYGESLLSVVEFLSAPAIRPPAVASAMLTGGHLERRLKMIVSRRATLAPRWLQATILTAVAGLLPLQIASAQNFNAVERRLGEAVSEGEITLDQARLMMTALKRSVAEGADAPHAPHSPGAHTLAPHAPKATFFPRKEAVELEFVEAPKAPPAPTPPKSVMRLQGKPPAGRVFRAESVDGSRQKIAELKAKLELLRSQGNVEDAKKVALVLREVMESAKAKQGRVLLREVREELIHEGIAPSKVWVEKKPKVDSNGSRVYRINREGQGSGTGFVRRAPKPSKGVSAGTIVESPQPKAVINQHRDALEAQLRESAVLLERQANALKATEREMVERELLLRALKDNLGSRAVLVEEAAEVVETKLEQAEERELRAREELAQIRARAEQARAIRAAQQADQAARRADEAAKREAERRSSRRGRRRDV